MYYLLTHSDFDGYCSSTVFKRFSKDSKVYNLSIKNFVKKFPKVINKLKEDDVLFVTDFSADMLVTRFDNISLDDKKIVWIDHHLYDEKTLRKSPKSVKFYLDTNHSASYLFYDFLKRNFNFEDKICEELVKICDIIDLFKLSEEWHYKLYEIITVNGAKKTIKILEKNIEKDGKVWNDKMEKIYEKSHLKILKMFEKILKKMYTFNCDEYKIGISPLVDLKYSSILFEYLNKYKDYDAVCFVGKKRLSLRSRNINVQVIAKEFGGGGHERAAGAYVLMSFKDIFLLKLFGKIPPDLLEKIKKSFEKYYT